MIQIKINEIVKGDSTSNISFTMNFTLPSVFGTGTSPIKGLDTIIKSFPDGFALDNISGIGTIITNTQVVTVDSNATANQIRTTLVNRYNSIRNKLDTITLKGIDALAGNTYDGTSWS